MVSQPSLAICQSTLLERISALVSGRTTVAIADESEWTLVAAEPPTGVAAERHEFGRRVTLSTEVTLEASYDSGVSWIETPSWGWIHLFPLGDRKGCLQATVLPPLRPGLDEVMDSLLLHCSSMLQRSIVGRSGPVHIQPSFPTLSRHLTDGRSLRIGSAAVRFDPLCGDGTAQSIRTGILAAAAVAASSDFGQAPILHYERRLAEAFARHLEGCSSFYRNAGFGETWREEVSELARAYPFTCDPRGGAFDFSLHHGRLLKRH
jgi:flavin-dependent dehydrogenase